MDSFVRRVFLLSSFAAFPLIAHAQSGRLTLEQHNPLPTNPPLPNSEALTDASQVIWWEPYNGDNVTIHDASGQPHNYQPGELRLVLGSLKTGNTASLYLFINSANIPALGVSEPWPNDGAEAVPWQWQDGVKVNSTLITLTSNGPAGLESQSVGQYQATRVGVVFVVLDALTGFEPKLPPQEGGNAPVIGYCNDYNREPLSVIEQDSTTSWQVQTTAGNPPQMVDGSALNRISFVSCDPGIQHEIEAKATATISANSSYTMYLALDSDDCDPKTFIPGQVLEEGGPGASNQTTTTASFPIGVYTTVKGLVGIHWVQACEVGNATVNGSGPFGGLMYGLTLKTKF